MRTLFSSPVVRSPSKPPTGEERGTQQNLSPIRKPRSTNGLQESDTIPNDVVAQEDYSWEADQLRAQQHIPVGGRLRFFWKFWREIGASRKIVRWLNKGYHLPFAVGADEEARSLLRTSFPTYLIPGYA